MLYSISEFFSLQDTEKPKLNPDGQKVKLLGHVTKKSWLDQALS